jgi:CheY-like chemotaxis protein/DNA-binding transcriptional ArsR family regulator
MRFLIVDDVVALREELVTLLEDSGHTVSSVDSISGAMDALEREEFDVLFTSLQSGPNHGMKLLTDARSRWPRMLVVMLAEHGTVEDAVGALRAGAFDYIRRPVQVAQVRRVLNLAAEQLSLKSAGMPERDPIEYARALAAEGGYEVLLIAPPPVPKELPGVTHVDLEPENPVHIREAVEDFALSRARVAVVLAAAEQLLARHREEEVASLLDGVRALLEGKGPLAVSYDPTKITATGALAVRASITGVDARTTLDAIASPIRRLVLRRLKEGEATFTQTLEAAHLDDTSLISFHLRKLVDSGLVEHAPEKKYRLSTRGGEAIAILDSIDGLSPGTASGNRAFAWKPPKEPPH